jgi:hypothetical protein
MPPVPQVGSSIFRTVPGVPSSSSSVDEEVHHQADDLTRGEVVPGGLIG